MERSFDRGFWVFGYGSLIWHPGFAFDDKRLAVLHGWRRAFCMASIMYRGTPEAPGLVLALDRDAGGHCLGLAYHVPPAAAEATLLYLRERELVSYAYDEARVRLDAGGEAVEALAYVSNRAHPQYRGGLSLDAQAEVIARARGPRGPNADYLLNTVESLEALGLHDPDLVRLAELVRARMALGTSGPDDFAPACRGSASDTLPIATHNIGGAIVRTRVNLSIEESVTREARELGLNMSRVAEAAIGEAARLERNRRWREENRDALEAYAREVEREGLPLARFRTF